MEKYVIGTDIGTTVAKVILFDKNGSEADCVMGKIPHFSPQPLYMEMDMDFVYESVCELIHTIVQKNGLSREQILGIGLSGQGEGLWPVGEDGGPVGNAIMWCDGRAGEIAQSFFNAPEKLGEIMSIAGGVLAQGSGGAVVKWMIEHDPQRFEKIKWIGTCHDWLKFKMTGEMTLGESYTADLLDVHQVAYSDRLLELYGIEAAKGKLPPLKRTVENYAPLTAAAAEKMGLSEGIPVVGGPFDMTACTLGVGALDPGCVGVVLGTSNIVAFPQTDSQGPPPKGVAVTKVHACYDRWLRMSGAMTATPNIEWAIDRLGASCGIIRDGSSNIYDQVEDLLNQVPLGCGGVMYHPYIGQTGERCPFMNPMARAQFTGLSLDTGSREMLRAVYEGIGYSVMDCIDGVGDCSVDQIRVSGGGSRSPFIMQLLADMTGVETVQVEGNESGAKGAAIIASVAAGVFDNVHDAASQIVRIKKRYSPIPENTVKYRKLYELYVMIRESAPGYWAKREEVLASL